MLARETSREGRDWRDERDGQHEGEPKSVQVAHFALDVPIARLRGWRTFPQPVRTWETLGKVDRHTARGTHENEQPRFSNHNGAPYLRSAPSGSDQQSWPQSEPRYRFPALV